jgi:hypothetical protein
MQLNIVRFIQPFDLIKNINHYQSNWHWEYNKQSFDI